MTTQDAIKHFGGVIKLSSALGLSRNAVYKWGDSPPFHQQFKIQKMTDGELTVSKQARQWMDELAA